MKSNLAIYVITTCTALVLGILFPSFFLFFTPYNSFILAFIFLITTITLRKIDTIDKKEISTVGLLTVWMLIVLPYLVFFITSLVIPAYTILLVLLACMPAGMTSPLLTRITSGKESFALLVTLITSLLAPLTIPFIMKNTVGSNISVPMKDMIISLTLVMILPCLLALTIRHFFPRVIGFVQKISSISVIFLAILIASSIAPYSSFLLSSFQSIEIITPLVIFFVFSFFYIYAVYCLTSFKKKNFIPHH